MLMDGMYAWYTYKDNEAPGWMIEGLLQGAAEESRRAAGLPIPEAWTEDE